MSTGPVATGITSSAPLPAAPRPTAPAPTSSTVTAVAEFAALTTKHIAPVVFFFTTACVTVGVWLHRSIEDSSRDTRADIATFRTEMTHAHNAMRAEMASDRAERHAEMASDRAERRAEQRDANARLDNIMNMFVTNKLASGASSSTNTANNTNSN